VIRDWRHAISYRDGEAFETVKSAIRAGKVQKKCKFRGVTVELKKGEVKGREDVDKWIETAVASGLFEEMFTLCDKPIVPLHIKSSPALRNEVPTPLQLSCTSLHAACTHTACTHALALFSHPWLCDLAL
jgi:hypothetical protein